MEYRGIKFQPIHTMDPYTHEEVNGFCLEEGVYDCWILPDINAMHKHIDDMLMNKEK